MNEMLPVAEHSMAMIFAKFRRSLSRSDFRNASKSIGRSNLKSSSQDSGSSGNAAAVEDLVFMMTFVVVLLEEDSAGAVV
jgi:hypothetical protein